MSNSRKTVEVNYIGTFDDGTKFDASADHGEPLKFICDVAMMIPGFDKAVIDMEVGEKKTVHVDPADAYGEYNPEAIETIPTYSIPNGDQLPVGKTIYFQGEEGFMPVKVVKVEDGMVTLDYNHPLAGKALNFEIELLSVSDEAIPPVPDYAADPTM